MRGRVPLRPNAGVQGKPWGFGRIAAFAAIFYFSEGLPFGIVTELTPLWMRSEGISLTKIGLLSTVGLAWSLKLFWAPLVDSRGSYRGWIRGSVAVIAAALFLISLSGADSSIFWIAITLLALASATQDIAVDALTITLTPPRRLGILNSIRVTAYRIALIAAGGGLAWVASRFGWRTAFVIAASIAAALWIASWFLPLLERRESTPLGVIAGIRRWLAQPGAGILLAIVFLYKLGDSSLSPMARPFWVDQGFDIAEIGTATAFIGTSFTIIGAWIGGWAIARWGVYRAMILFGILQIASNAVYAVIAPMPPERLFLYLANVTESLTYGLGTGAFIALLMLICDRERAATEFALLSALFGLSRHLAGMGSGALADAFGYTSYFWITVALGVPGLLLVPLARRTIVARESGTAAGA